MDLSVCFGRSAWMDKIVAIVDTLTAAKQLRTRHPEAQIFCIRIGHRAVCRFGYGRSASY
jgi:hypothetical protein